MWRWVCVPMSVVFGGVGGALVLVMACCWTLSVVAWELLVGEWKVFW